MEKKEEDIYSICLQGHNGDIVVYLALALNTLLSFSLSAQLADTPAREIFGISADTLSVLTFISSLSIVGQID